MNVRLFRIAALVAGLAASALAWSSGVAFDVERFDVAGNTLLPATEVERVLAPHLGKARSFDDVQRAARALEEAYAAQGYGMVRVGVPEQEVAGGVVRLRVVQPRVTKVTVEGNVQFDAANIRRSLPALREGETPDTGALARNLQLAAEHPAKRTEVLLRAGTAEDALEAVARVADDKPDRVFLTLDNTGNGETGYYRAGLGYQHANLFNRDHLLNAQVVTSPTRADRVAIVGVGYKVPFYDWNSSLELAAGYSDVSSGTLQGLFNVSGSGAIGSARWNWILPRWGALEQKLSASLDYRAFRNEVLFQNQQVVPDITIHPLGLTYSGTRRGADSELSFYASVSRNLPGGNDGGAADFERTRAGASARYTIVRYGLNFQKALAGDWQLRLGANGQSTGDALVPGEQFGVGGPDSVRGYLPREVANDRGYAIQLEAQTPDFARALGLSGDHRLRAIAFADSGSVTRNQPLPGELAHDSIGSVGIGARWGYGRSANLRVDLAQILQPTPNREKGSLRLGFALAIGF